MEFYQARYGKPDGMQWEEFDNTIPDFLKSYKDLFSKAARACTPGMVRKGPERGLPQDLYEIIILTEATCLLRAQYGNFSAEGASGKDTRDVMFAHGFLFHTKDIAEHPEYILSVQDENFRLDASTQEGPKDVLSCDQPLSKETAMAEARLTTQTWKKLMACIYAQKDSRSNTPLHIRVTDRNQMKALIFCILTALPKQLRFLFAFSNESSISGTIYDNKASGENSLPQQVLFTDSIPSPQSLYFDPVTGETNCDLQDIKERRVIYPTYDAFCNDSPDEYAEYCDALSEKISELRLPSFISLDEMELANRFVVGSDGLASLNETDSWKYVLSLVRKLRANRIQSLYTDDFLADILERCNDRDFIPNDRIMEYIVGFCTNTESFRLLEIYKKLQMRVLINSGKEEVDSFLKQKYEKQDPDFHMWCERIMEIEGGADCIRSFYEGYMRNTSDYEELDQIYKDGARYMELAVWDEAALRQFVHFSEERFSCGNVSTDDFEQEFDLLYDALRRSFGNKDRSVYYTVSEKIREHFWKRFDISCFEFTEKCTGNCNVMEYENHNQMKPLYELYGIVRQY